MGSYGQQSDKTVQEGRTLRRRLVHGSFGWQPGPTSKFTKPTVTAGTTGASAAPSASKTGQANAAPWMKPQQQADTQMDPATEDEASGTEPAKVGEPNNSRYKDLKREEALCKAQLRTAKLFTGAAAEGQIKVYD